MSKRSRSGSASSSSASRSPPLSAAALKLDLGAAAADFALAVDLRDAAAERGAEVEPANREAPDVDVVFRQQRPGLARSQHRQPGQRRIVARQQIDRQPVEQPARRPPVERDLRRGEEQAARVIEPEAAELRAAVERAVDPVDRDAQAGGRPQRSDAVDQEAMARRRCRAAPPPRASARSDQRRDRAAAPQRQQPSPPSEGLAERDIDRDAAVALLAVERRADVDPDRAEARVIAHAEAGAVCEMR